MKVAIWSDGTKTTRKTHTKDYKFAYRFRFTDDSNWIIGFSTTKKAVESALRTSSNAVVSKPRGNDMNVNRWYSKYLQSDDYKRALVLTEFAKNNSEIVEVA